MTRPATNAPGRARLAARGAVTAPSARPRTEPVLDEPVPDEPVLAEPVPDEPVLDDTPARRRPLYASLLRLRHIAPNGWQCALLGDGALAVAAVLVLADVASAWTLLALPLGVALVVKAHDLLAGLVGPAPAPRLGAGSPPAAGTHAGSPPAARTHGGSPPGSGPGERPRGGD